jgi:hypothetical protein
MSNKLVTINGLISIGMFVYIFYSNIGISGGDMAIIAFNIIFGIFQIIMVAIFANRNNSKSLIIITVIILQIIELIIFIKWGYLINEYLKK